MNVCLIIVSISLFWISTDLAIAILNLVLIMIRLLAEY